MGENVDEADEKFFDEDVDVVTDTFFNFTLVFRYSNY